MRANDHPAVRFADLTGALCGVAAGGAALAAAQVGGKLVPGAQPPLTVLGDWVIRITPVSLTEALIRQVGRSDKLVLLICIVVVATVAAALVGVGYLRGHRRTALRAIAALALLPAAATHGSAGTSVLRELLVLLPAAAVGALVLSALGQPLIEAEPPREPPAQQSQVARAAAAEHARLVNGFRLLQRRQVLRAALVLGAAAAAGTAVVRHLGQPSLALVNRLRVALPAPKNLLPPLSDEFAALGASPLVTPIESFYRIDTALSPPQVDPDTWTLTLSRDGAALRTYTYAELLARATSQADITIGCVSNEIGGDLIGTARWQGVLLADLLRDAGVTRAGRVTGRSVDGFVASFPGGLAFDGRPAMVAVGMNGQPLPVLHGFPARLVVPGLYGYTSATKWLEQIDVSDRTDLPGFWADRGWAPDVRVHLTSRIDTPTDGAALPAGPARLAGVAWAPIVGVGLVEVQIDGGAWRPARLSTAVTGVLWRQWVLDWDPTRGSHTVQVRATDTNGLVQDAERRDVFPSGATGLHRVRVNVR